MILCEYAHAMGNSVGNFMDYVSLFETYDNLQGGFIWDWMDQGLARLPDATTQCLERERCPPAPPADPLSPRQFYGFGGDYGPPGTPSDLNFNFNGLVDPDWRWHPAAYEVKVGYSNVAGRLNGKQREREKRHE